jgi:SAM-dependent methyltransferase
VDERAPGFYDTYASYKGYRTPSIDAKLIRRFDAEIWHPAQCAADMSFLEIGCGTGAFLGYLDAKGVARRIGIDHDPALADIVPAAVRADFRHGDALALLNGSADGPFDRVVLLDVLEHFSPDEARTLLETIRPRLTAAGKIVLKVPNAASPWGLSYQFGDLTHRTPFSAQSLRQLADSAGFSAVIRPQRQGTRRRRLTDAVVNRILTWALLTPPEVWSANLYAILTPRTEPRR